MGMGLTKEVGTNSIPVWQGIGKDIQVAQGGFSLTTTGLTAGVLIPKGTPINFSESTRVATVVTTAILYADATNVATEYQVKKGHTFKLGDYLAAVVGAKAYAITVIDTSNADYDILTVGTTLGAALSAGTLMFRSTATGAAAAVYQTFNGLLYDDTIVGTGESISAVIRGTVYARRVPYSTAIATALPQIIYSQSK